MGTKSQVLAMGSPIAAPDTPGIFGSGRVDDYDDASGVWFNNNDGGQPGFFHHRYKWVPAAVDAPPLDDIMALGLGPPEVKIRLRVAGQSVGSSGVSVLKDSTTGSVGIDSVAFIPDGTYAEPTWFDSITYTVGLADWWNPWLAGDIRISPITASGATLQICEVEVTVTWPTQSAPAPLRLYPRSLTRLYPRRRTRRPGTF